MTHTPGPWALNGLTVEALADPENSTTYVAPIAVIDAEWTSSISNANAALISAAPELLAIVEQIVNLTLDDNDPAHRAIIREATAAIAKAKGR